MTELELKAFVQTITAEPRYVNDTGKTDPDNPVWKVTFFLAPYNDVRSLDHKPQVTSGQSIVAYYNDAPPFQAGDMLEWVIR